nr:hypothetical protein BaRGS_011019 [Batillaria attramentaria]
MQCPNGLVFDARQKVCIWDSTARSCAPDTKLEPIKPWQPSDSSNKVLTILLTKASQTLYSFNEMIKETRESKKKSKSLGLDESNGNNGVEVIRGKFLSVKNPKDRNSGYSLRSYDDAKDTDSKPMRSPFDSPRKENPAHRRGLYGAPNTKNFDYFDVPKTDQSRIQATGYRDFKNPEDVQIEKFMINLLNDAMRSKHVVSRDISDEGLIAAQPNKFSAKKSPSMDNNDNLITFNLETDEVFDKHLLNDAGDMGEKKYKKKKENVIISTKGLNQQLPV